MRYRDTEPVPGSTVFLRLIFKTGGATGMTAPQVLVCFLPLVVYIIL
jgi:hypothetical protein